MHMRVKIPPPSTYRLKSQSLFTVRGKRQSNIHAGRPRVGGVPRAGTYRRLPHQAEWRRFQCTDGQGMCRGRSHCSLVMAALFWEKGKFF
jgi:hypothetical protein